jgi:hypothetical protein
MKKHTTHFQANLFKSRFVKITLLALFCFLVLFFTGQSYVKNIFTVSPSPETNNSRLETTTAGSKTTITDSETINTPPEAGTNIFAKKSLLAYCPTMEPVAMRIFGLNENIALKRMDSTAEIMFDLSNGAVDIALVGRLATSLEKGSAQELVIGTGYTLIGRQKIFISRSSLASAIVHTSVSDITAKELLPGSDIIFYDSLDEAVSNGISDAVLISWDDFKEGYNLIVVMDGVHKAPEFRIPVLYSINYNLSKLNIDI